MSGSSILALSNLLKESQSEADKRSQVNYC